jgi:hypothetical protein
MRTSHSSNNILSLQPVKATMHRADGPGQLGRHVHHAASQREEKASSWQSVSWPIPARLNETIDMLSWEFNFRIQ